MTIGERIKCVRGSMSQLDFATRTGLNKGTLSRYERNTTVPDANTIVRICSAFDIRPEWLLTGEGMPSKKNPEDEENAGPSGSQTITANNLEYNKRILDAISQAFDEVVKQHELAVPFLSKAKFRNLVYILYEEFMVVAMDYIPTMRGTFEKQIERKNNAIKMLLEKIRKHDEKLDKFYLQQEIENFKANQDIYDDIFTTLEKDDPIYKEHENNIMIYMNADIVGLNQYDPDLWEKVKKLKKIGLDLTNPEDVKNKIKKRGLKIDDPNLYEKLLKGSD